MHSSTAGAIVGLKPGFELETGRSRGDAAGDGSVELPSGSATNFSLTIPSISEVLWGNQLIAVLPNDAAWCHGVVDVDIQDDADAGSMKMIEHQSADRKRSESGTV